MSIEIKWIVVCVLLITGVLLLLWRGKRRFDRSNSVGVDQFNSYTGKVAASLVDRIMLSSGWVMIVGGISIVVFYDNSPESWLSLPILIIVTKFLSSTFEKR